KPGRRSYGAVRKGGSSFSGLPVRFVPPIVLPALMLLLHKERRPEHSVAIADGQHDQIALFLHPNVDALLGPAHLAPHLQRAFVLYAWARPTDALHTPQVRCALILH